MKKLLLTALFIAPLLIQAQEDSLRPFYTQLEWDPKGKRCDWCSNDSTNQAEYGMDKLMIEYYYSPTYNYNLVEYRTFHKLIRVHTERAVNSYNQIYMNLNNAVDLIEAKARVIKPNGEVVYLKKEDILEAENFEEYGRFKYFALEGIEVGSDIEYTYTILKVPYLNGSMYTFQSDVPHHQVEFRLLAPENLSFDFLSMNGFPEMQRDSSDTARNSWFAQSNKIPALYNEPYSAYDVSLQGVQYKIEENSARGTSNLVSYTEFAQELYEAIYPENYDGDYDKLLTGLSKQLKLSKAEPSSKVRKIESYVKQNFQMLDQNTEDLANIENILKDRICSNLGLLRLYAYWFDLEGIPFELGITSQRDEQRFEKDFETYSCLNDYFFYFPDLDAYIAYEYPAYRLGSKPPGWEHNYGLFIKPITIGNFTTGLAQVKWIAPSPASKNKDDLDVEVSLGADLSEPQVTFSRIMTGQSAVFFQPAYESLNPDEQQQIADALIQFIGDEEEVVQSEVLNTGEGDIGVKPFLIKGTLNYPNLLQQAGNKYLVKLGKVIGPQSELYQEEKRTLSVENDYNRTYLRKIVFHIPEGYQLKNPEAVEFNEVIEKDGEVIMQFVSKYRLEGNDLVVDIDEFYNQIELPKEDFEPFKAVINAAADFNKVVLLLEPM